MSRQTVSSIHSIPQKQPPISLARRLLFPLSTANDLPALLESSSSSSELTLEVYDFIALALRAFVNPWWTKITRYDKEFLPEINRILTVVIRALEERVTSTDLAPLLYRDIPVIVTQHYRDYRNANAKLSTSYASGGAMSLPQLFHQLQPHLALSPDGTIDRDYFRQVVDNVLKALLPEDCYAPEAERIIIREVLLKVVLNDIIPKITQPWFINKALLDVLGEPAPIPIKQADPTTPATPFSFHTVLVILLSTLQSISGIGLAFTNAYKNAVGTIKLVNQSSPRPQHKPSPYISTPLAPSIPTAISRNSEVLLDPLSGSTTSSISSHTVPTAPFGNRDIDEPISPIEDLSYPPLMMVAEVFSTHERLASISIMNILLFTTSFFAVFLDRLLPYMLQRFFSQEFLLKIVRIGKRTLFPNGYPAPPPIDPTPQEQAEMRAKLLAWKGHGAAAHVIPVFLGSDTSQSIRGVIDPLSSAPCNVHLVMMILDRVFVALFPELVGAVEHRTDTTPS